MKDLTYLLLIIFLSSCSNKDHNLDWLLGKWERTNNKKGTITYEQWQRKDSVYTGLGFTLQGNDTIFKENMRILKINGVWNLEVNGVNPEPTYFYFTNQTENGFVCENPDNEFPKVIEYFIEDKKLTAIISDETTKIPFYFK